MVKTTSGATAVQIVRWSRNVGHLDSVHDDAELELLKAVGRPRLAAGQGELHLGPEPADPASRGAGGAALPIMSSRMGYLLDALDPRLPGLAALTWPDWRPAT